jgi:hypothetical protein
MPGLYWDDEARQGSTPKCRGIPRQYADAIIRTFDAHFDRLAAGERPGWLTYDISYAVPIPFTYITLKQGLAWNRWSEVGIPIRDATKEIGHEDALDKRKRALRHVTGGITWLDMIDVEPIDSTSYDKDFGVRAMLDELGEDLPTMDGMTFADEVAWELGLRG